MPRQQRAAQNRRSLTPGNPAYPAEIVWEITADAGNILTIALATSEAELVISGVPALLSTNFPTGPIAAAMVGGFLELTYPGAITNPDTYSLRSGDPSIRTKWGGFLAGDSQPWTGPPPPPDPPEPDQDWTASLNPDGTVFIGSSPPATVGYQMNLKAWNNDTQAVGISNSQSDGINITLTFPGGVNSGDSITYASESLTTTGSPTAQLLSKSVVVV